MLADVRVLILDEPTEHLDEPTEHLDEPTARGFAAGLPAATGGRTDVVLTHRPELFSGDAWSRGPDLGEPVEAEVATESGLGVRNLALSG